VKKVVFLPEWVYYMVGKGVQAMREKLPPEELKELVLQAKQGDEDALNEVCNEMEPMIVEVAGKMHSKYPSLSRDDLIQEGIESLIKAVANYDPQKGKNPSTYFYKYIYGAMRNYKNRELRERSGTISLDALSRMNEEGEEIPWEIPDDRLLTSWEEYVNEEMREALRKAIENFDEPARSIIIMRDFEELPFEEIASRLGKKVETVKTIYYRSLKKLKEDPGLQGWIQ